MNDSTPEMPDPAETVESAVPVEDAAAEKPTFTKEPQPELSLALRKEKAGWNRNRVGTYFVVGGFAIVLIIIGLVGILTKAR